MRITIGPFDFRIYRTNGARRPPMMKPKEAIAAAWKALHDYESFDAADFPRLEGIEYFEDGQRWEIILSFIARAPNEPTPFNVGNFGIDHQHERVYRTIHIDELGTSPPKMTPWIPPVHKV